MALTFALHYSHLSPVLLEDLKELVDVLYLLKGLVGNQREENDSLGAFAERVDFRSAPVLVGLQRGEGTPCQCPWFICHLR